MGKRKCLLSVLLMVAMGTFMFAETATVTYVNGKVEVQRNGKWLALKNGDQIQTSEIISTGFQSEAKVKLFDSVLCLGPVTRITVEELSANGNQDNVNVYLKTGAVRSQVKHVENKRVNYQVHTAVAVASCRGTGWDMDSDNNVDCFEGFVAVSCGGDALEDGILVQRGQSVRVSKIEGVSETVNNTVKQIANVSSAVDSEASKEAVYSGSSLEKPVLSDSNTDIKTVPLKIKISYNRD